MTTKQQPSMQALEAFIIEKGPEYLARDNVTSIGIGYKGKRKRSSNLRIQFTVETKYSIQSLCEREMEPLPKSIHIEDVPVPVDVIERGYNVTAVAAVAAVATPDPSLEMRKQFANPIVPGVSIGHVSVSAGTVGAVVYDAENGTPYLLSNWHVLQGNAGKIGDPVVQPGPSDHSEVTVNTIGNLVRGFLGENGDCAICSVEHRTYNPMILGHDISVKRIGDPRLGDRVVKSGRTTGVTWGIIKRGPVLFSVRYGTLGDRMIKGFEVHPDPERPAPELSMPGDSGSVYMSVYRGKVTDRMVGLHFAGETGDADDVALACYATSVFAELKIVPAPPASLALPVKRRDHESELLVVNIPAPSQPVRRPKSHRARKTSAPQVDLTRIAEFRSKSSEDPSA